MRIYNSDGDIAYKTFKFPDGQPHIELEQVPAKPMVTIEAAIRNPDELFNVVLAATVLQAAHKSIKLDIRYLMGARMDRPISETQPFTLQTVCNVLRSIPFYGIRILDPHSPAAGQRLYASPVYPFTAIDTVLNHYDPDYTWIVAPDKGAQERVRTLARHHAASFGILEGFKTRDMQTGKLSGFGVKAPSPTALVGKSAIIIDDICDGGGTFSGLAAVLRDAGATSVNLFVTHGIFSKGLPIPGIDRVWTTDSYYTPGYETLDNCLTVIPVSMQEM